MGLAILRTNLLENRATKILYTDTLPKGFNSDLLKSVYNYNFEVEQIENLETVEVFEGTTILISKQKSIETNLQHKHIDFYVNLFEGLGSVLLVSAEEKNSFISDIQHVRRRETIAMTPANCLVALEALTEQKAISMTTNEVKNHKTEVTSIINNINATSGEALVASS